MNDGVSGLGAGKRILGVVKEAEVRKGGETKTMTMATDRVVDE